MPLLVTNVGGVAEEFFAAMETSLADAKRETPAAELRFVNVGPDRVTVLVPTAKTFITSDWRMLEPERRPDGKVFQRYTTARGMGESAEKLAERVTELLRRE